jgi:transposase
LRLFVAGVPARTAAELTGVNRNTAILFFHKLREIITARLAEEAPFLDGEIEVDESYFGGRRKGKQGRGAAGKVPVFGLLKRGGKVHAVMIPDAKSLTLIGIIRQRIQPDSIVYTDSFGSYDILDVSEFHHHRINHSQAFAAERNHINGIENFWNQAKWRTVAMLAGPKPVRDRALSSPKVTSSTQWRLFSMAQWLRTDSASAAGLMLRDET